MKTKRCNSIQTTPSQDLQLFLIFLFPRVYIHFTLLTSHHLSDISTTAPFTTPDLHLHSTQDLLARFRIQSSYDAFVKPYVTPLSEQTRGPANLHDVKGKGKETIRVAPDTVDGVDRIGQNVPLAAGSPVADGAPPKEKRRKHDKTYKSLYSDLPGSFE
jgi:hypothetical protein